MAGKISEKIDASKAIIPVIKDPIRIGSI